MKGKPIFLHVSLSDKILFVKHLSIMVKSGMSLLDGLRLLQKQVRSASFSYIMRVVIMDVENGQFLSESLRKFGRVFDALFINVIKVGEETGTLADNLVYLASELKKKQIMRSKIRSALIYPIVILFATLGVSGILVFFVLPRLLPVFQSLRVDLPLPTRILVAVTAFLLNYGAWLLGGLVVLFIVWYFFLLRISAIRYINHRLILATPLIGSLSRMANIADFTRTLGLLLKSGSRIVEAILITSESVTNVVYKKALREAAETVRRGNPFDQYLTKHENLFYPTVTRMIEVGNLTGTLESNLFYLAEFYESEIDESTKNLTTIMEPLLLLVMGAIVGFVAISIITPIYQITQSIGR